MHSSRDAFLQRVRTALQTGRPAGHAATLQPRGRVGYQGAGPDPVSRFRDEMRAAGGVFHTAPDTPAAVALILGLVRDRAARTALVGRGPVIDRLALPDSLRAAEVEPMTVDQLGEPDGRDRLFAAEIGITGVDYLIAETGSLVVLAAPEQPRSLSLLPPVHIAVAEPRQIVPDLFDLFERLGPEPRLPSGLTLITGPSKTGDIELKLVTGVHGPGEVHLVLVGA